MIERRRFMQALATATVLPALAETPQPAAADPTSPQDEPPAGAPETADLAPIPADDAAVDVPRLFDDEQLAALRRLCDLLMPPVDEAPGARDAGVAEFLDFHVRKSPDSRRELYRAGLAALDASSKRAHGTPFAALSDQQADAVLAPLRQPWTPGAPSDPLDAFLRVAKEDVRAATINSHAYVDSAERREGRGFRRRGAGLYWYRLE